MSLACILTFGKKATHPLGKAIPFFKGLEYLLASKETNGQQPKILALRAILSMHAPQRNGCEA